MIKELQKRNIIILIISLVILVSYVVYFIFSSKAYITIEFKDLNVSNLEKIQIESEKGKEIGYKIRNGKIVFDINITNYRGTFKMSLPKRFAGIDENGSVLIDVELIEDTFDENNNFSKMYIDMIYEYKPKEKELYVKTKWKYKKRQKPYEREQKFNEFDKINIWFGI